ncbi:MAG: protoheme IX farnesyltransferase, partial [Deltaproteobacteria bacterium]|nr:protoheme IX farnesyltransferase [Deltaproteobacteria bacterium]
MRESPPSLASDILQLGKPRITLLVVITTVMGFKMADAGVTDWPRLLTMLVGTALVSLGINSLNQLME